jgi:hypothetical protein
MARTNNRTDVALTAFEQVLVEALAVMVDRELDRERARPCEARRAAENVEEKQEMRNGPVSPGPSAR